MLILMTVVMNVLVRTQGTAISLNLDNSTVCFWLTSLYLSGIASKWPLLETV